MLLTCRKLGIPIAEGKIEGPTAVIINYFPRNPPRYDQNGTMPTKDKLEDLLLLLKQWTRLGKKTTIRELL